ncbi:hypothetical protein JCM8208_004524 [Rhodotorula glutinis]
MSAPPVVEPSDPLFRQLKSTYSFFKDARASTHREESTSPSQHNAVIRANRAADRGPPCLAQSWTDLSFLQHIRMLELLLKYYCESRADLDYDLAPMAFTRLRNDVLNLCYHESERELAGDTPDPFEHVDMLLRLLVPLYSGSIEAREFSAFEELRHDIGQARARLARAQPGGHKEHSQGVYDDARARLYERLKEVNAERVEHLQQVKAAFSLLHDNAALVPGFTDASQHAAVEVYFSRLDPGQQAAVVARVRNFVFAACEERAVRGEALDADEHLVDILAALHARDLGHALCAARLNSIVYFFESHDAPSAVVEHFQGVVDQFCGDVWAHRFPQLALSQQLYAVGMVRALLGRIQPLTARQVADELSVILPMSSSNPTSWKHAPRVDGPPVLLRSLAHVPSTHHAPFGADSTASSTSSRYFPQARSARW